MTNCLIWSISYRFKHPHSKIKREWDPDLCWYHYYIIDGAFEFHCEQKDKDRPWRPLFKEEIHKIRLRKKNNK